MKKVRIIFNSVEPLGFCKIGVVYSAGDFYYEYEITNRRDYDEIIRMERKGYTSWINKLKQWPHTKTAIKEQVHGP